MKNFKGKILILLAFVLVITIGPVLDVKAASGTMSVTVSNANVNAGDNFTVTVQYSGSTVIAYGSFILNYDSSLVSCGGYSGAITYRFDPDQSDNAKAFSQTYTFTAKAVGTVSFSLSGVEVYNLNPADGDIVNVTTSGASVKISAKGSSNANLSSLKLSAGSLSPSFSNNTSTYTVTVPNSVTSISISAVAADSKAKVSVSGSNDVPEGNSSRVIIVTAEDGTVKKFTININRAAAVKVTPAASPTPPTTPTNTSGVLPVPTTDPSNLPDELEVTAGGAILVITDKPAEVTLPAGFEEVQYTYRDRPVWAAQAKDQGLLIMYLQDQANEKSGFYLYDEALDEFTKYIILYTQASSYTLIQRPDTVSVPEGYVEKMAVIDGENVTVWVPAAMKYMDAEVCEFYLVYAVSQSGYKGFYVYDTVEKTFQRFSTDIAMSSPDASTDIEGTPAPGDVENPNPDEDNSDEGGIWAGIKGFFSRIFTGGARAIDWFLFGCIIFVLVLVVILIIFIVYATQKHKEEAADEDFPLAAHSEKEKSFRKANLFNIDEELKGEPEAEAASEGSTEDKESSEPGEAAVQDEEKDRTEVIEWEDDEITELEPEINDGSQEEYESQQTLAADEKGNETDYEQKPQADVDVEIAESDPLNFNIDDLKKVDETKWSFDDEIGEDFFSDDKN